MTIEKCIKKAISELELDEVIAGRLAEPQFKRQEYTKACYDCDGFNHDCPFYETEEELQNPLLIMYDSFLYKRTRGTLNTSYQFKRKKK